MSHRLADVPERAQFFHRGVALDIERLAAAPEGSLITTADGWLAWRKIGPKKHDWQPQKPSPFGDGWEATAGLSGIRLFPELTRRLANEPMVLFVPRAAERNGRKAKKLTKGSRAKARAKACKSKYLGRKVTLRRREGEVVGCAVPSRASKAKKPPSRFRVKFEGAKEDRLVPRPRVYRAVFCETHPDAKRCAPLSESRSRDPWQTSRKLAHKTEALLDRWERGEIEPDPFGESDCSPPASPRARDVWRLTQRIPCATDKGRRVLRDAREAEFAAMVATRDLDGIEQYNRLLFSGCAPACDPSGPRSDEGQCDKRITAREITAWETGAEPVPQFFYDTDRPHKIGGSSDCYYSESIWERRALHDHVIATTRVPAEIQSQGMEAVSRYLANVAREAEQSHPLHEAWEQLDARIFQKIRAPHRFGDNDLRDLSYAFVALQEGDSGPAYKISDRLRTTAADNEVDEATIVDSILEAWVEQQQSSSEKGRAARIERFQKRVRREGAWAVANAVARAQLGGRGVPV